MMDIVRPVLARLQKQFEEQYMDSVDPEHPRNSKTMSRVSQLRKPFKSRLTVSFNTFIKMGNPFLDDFPELVTLDNRNCIDDSVTAALHTLEDTGTT